MELGLRKCHSCLYQNSRSPQCSGSRPACSNCLDLGRVCEYDEETKRKKAAWRVTVDALRQRNGELEEIIRNLKFNTESDALRVLQQLREEQPTSPTSPASAAPSVFAPESPAEVTFGDSVRGALPSPFQTNVLSLLSGILPRAFGLGFWPRLLA